MRKTLGLMAAAGALLLGGCDSMFIFEPDRQLHASPADFPFPVVDVTVPVRMDDEPLEYQHLDGWFIPSGSGTKTVLYLHGNDGNVSVTVREVTPLRELHYSVFIVDYRGFGKSDGGFPSEETVYQDAEAAWSYLVHQRGVDPSELYIYGHSLGGAIAIDLACRHPESAGLIVESTFTSIYDMAQADRLYSKLPLNLLLHQRFESLRKVPTLKLPVLMMHGTADELVPYSMGEQLFAAVPGPKRFVPLKLGRHDHDAGAVPVIREAVERFVRDTSARRISSAPASADEGR